MKLIYGFASQDALLAAQKEIDALGLRLTGKSRMAQAVVQAERVFDRGLVIAASALMSLVIIATLALLVGIANERRATITLYRLQGAAWWHLTPIFAAGPALVVFAASGSALILVETFLPHWLSTQLSTLLEQAGQGDLKHQADLPSHWWWLPLLVLSVAGAVIPVILWATRASLWTCIRKDHC